MPVTIHLHASPTDLPVGHLWIVGRREALLAPAARALLPKGLAPEVWEALVGKSVPGDDGRTSGTWLAGAKPRRVVACVLPEACSRHSTPSRAWAVPRLLAGVPTKGVSSVLFVPDDPAWLPAQVMGLARAFPTYGARKETPDGTLHVAASVRLDVSALGPRVKAVRFAADLVDRPPNVLDVDAFVQTASDVAASLPGVTLTVVRGEALREAGLGGLWSVGKAAQCAPALVVLDHHPEGAQAHDAWVGKGIVYDTGGLSLKTKTGMPGMKTDMGGAAAVLAAFEAAVHLDTPRRLTAVLCLAENAIGPLALRPDDIIQMLSGRTVEINNTDAEGRLVLADGVAWVTAHRSPDAIIDLATLTGAQGIATGQHHAAIVSDSDDLEAAAIHAGKATGDLVHPLPFAPEFHTREFRSQVADLKNSVKNRSNAQSSCAAEFIRQHMLGFEGAWLHVDMAAPSTYGGRATGYGVGLLLGLLDR